MSDQNSDSSSDYSRYNTTRTYSGGRTPPKNSSSSPRMINIIDRVDPFPYLYNPSSQAAPDRSSDRDPIIHNRLQVPEQSSHRHITHHAADNPDIIDLPDFRPKKRTPYSSHGAIGRTNQDSVKPSPDSAKVSANSGKSHQDGRKSPYSHSKPKNRQLDIVEPGSDGFQKRFMEELGTDSRVSIQLRMPNVFSSFMSNELQKGDSLWDLVVLTGDPNPSRTSSKPNGLWSTTCGSYIAETWPAASDRIQKLVNRLEVDSDLNTSLDLSSPVYGNVSVAIEQHFLTTGDTELALGFRGKLDSMIDILEGISWLFSTLQTWEKDEPAACSVLWRRQPQISNDIVAPGQSYDITYNLYISDLYPLSVPEKSSCWKPLFPSTPCSTGFTARPRPAAMHGVEMQFELLYQLCGLDYMTHDQKGLLLFGPKSLVYPVRAEGNCVQWHFQHCEPDNEDQHNITGERLCTLDLESLCGPFTRHFLGLWSKSTVTLGTDLQKYDQLEFSEAKEVPQETIRDGYSYGAAVSIKGILSLNWNQNFKIANTRKPMTMTSITNRLHSSMNEPVMLYSPSEERAWMVPFMSVFWHLLRAQADAKKRFGYSIPACEQSGDGAEAALECFLNSRNKPIRTPVRNQRLTQEEEKETIQDFAEDLWRTLDLAIRQTSVSKKFFRKSIVGFEFAAIAECMSSMTLRSYDLNYTTGHSWAPFLDRVRLTFFYEGLLDPILPSREMSFSGACGRTTWRAVPKHHNLLTASLPCLAASTRDLNGGRDRLARVAPGKCWSTTRRPGTLFSMCSSTSSHTCDRILQLDKEDKATDPLIFKTDAAKDGAVVFRFKHKFEDIVGTRRTSSPIDNGFLRPPTPNTSPLGSGRSSPRVSNQSSPSRGSHGRTDSGYSSASRPSHVSRPSTGSDISSVAVASEEEDTRSNSTNSSKRKSGKMKTKVVKRGGKLYEVRYRDS